MCGKSKYGSMQERIIANSVLAEHGDCWLWMGARLKSGYGRMNVMTPAGEHFATLAHRVSYRAFKGGETYEKDVHHVCGNRSCVNPEHLQVMSHRENCATGRRRNGTNGAQRGEGGRFKK
jgi:hypothetical protein